MFQNRFNKLLWAQRFTPYTRIERSELDAAIPPVRQDQDRQPEAKPPFPRRGPNAWI